MSEKGFEPLSPQLGIAGTSYRLQLGLINEKWASRILRGKDIIDSYIYKERDLGGSGEDTFPNLNFIVGWVLRTVAIPNINPYQIQKTAQVLVKKAIDKKKERKIVASVDEAKDVKLEVVPESELKRPQAKGWVKEDGEKTKSEIEEEQRKAFKERVKAQKDGPEPTTVKTTRKLPSIPKAGDPAEVSSVSKQVTSTEVSPGGDSKFCPSCGKDLTWVFCPYCGGKLPENGGSHEH